MNTIQAIMKSKQLSFIIILTFIVLVSLPFLIYIYKQEEKERNAQLKHYRTLITPSEKNGIQGISNMVFDSVSNVLIATSSSKKFEISVIKFINKNRTEKPLNDLYFFCSKAEQKFLWSFVINTDFINTNKTISDAIKNLVKDKSNNCYEL